MIVLDLGCGQARSDQPQEHLMLGMSVASVGERVACARVRRRLCTGGKRIRTLGPRYVNDAIETILIAGLAFAFLPERPARSQGGTDGSNPLSSSGESHCEPAGHPLKGSRPKPRRVRAPASAIRRRAGTNRAASWPRSGGIRASCTRASASRHQSARPAERVVEASPRGAVIALRDDRFANPAGLVDLIQRNAGTLKIRPDQKIVYLRNWDDEKERLAGVARLLQALVKIARAAKAAGDAQLPPASPALVNPRVARRA
jgi:hypothetical protein